MIQITPLSDNRLDLVCSYCGENYPDTRDHVPSKILLNEPYPENLPVVPCCSECNQSFSLDEEYVACLLECAIHGTTSVEKLTRTKIKNILAKKESLRNRLSNAIIPINGEISFNPEIERLENVFVKLAKGHVKYENSEPEFEQPTHWGFKPLFNMSAQEKEMFYTHKEMRKCPEIGSRVSMRLLIAKNNKVYSDWQIVQPDIYRYMVTINPLSVRMVIWNYLAVEVIW
jgi:hypothetical protein